MSTTINTGWLKDNNGDKFAPKTLTSQVQTSDGVLLENKIETDILSAKDDMQKYTDTVVSDKADADHNHDDVYYTEIEVDTLLAEKSDITHNHDNDYDEKGSADIALDSAKEYTDTKTANLASTTVVDNKISAHNTSTSAHNDIRDLIAGLTTRLNTLADSDDTTLDQMSEVVEYIKANKTLIDSVTTSKVNVSDIVNNLTTSVSNKPLSAAQGVAIKSLIDALQTAVDGKAASSHTHNYAGSSSAGGSANSAVKWSTARNINGMSVDGSANRTNYGTCSTAASTAAKTVVCDGFSLITGAEITVKFTVSNTADSPTLNVNGTGAKPIFYRGAAITKTYIVANRTYTFRYDGTNWDFVGDINVDTNTDTKVTQTNTASTNADYRLLMSSTADDTSRAEAARKNANLKYNPSTGVLSAPVFSGSVDASNINGVVPISKGGTDATTVAGAQENLGILTPDEIVNLYVWKKYDGNPDEPQETSKTNVNITGKTISTNSYCKDIQYADEIVITNEVLSLVDPTTLSNITIDTIDVVKGKYVQAVNFVGTVTGTYFIPTDATISATTSGTYYLRADKATLLTARTAKCYAASTESNGHVTDSADTDGYWYVYHKQLGE